MKSEVQALVGIVGLAMAMVCFSEPAIAQLSEFSDEIVEVYCRLEFIDH